eukprot:COSAG01_NODE_1_length_100484_cov_170.446142_22_plen_322_part_00
MILAHMDYKSAGVNIDAGNQAVDRIKNKVASTHSSAVLGGLGGFAAAYDLSAFKHYDEPVMVSCTDGVGTKLKLAIEANKLDTVGIDLVAMSVNDLVCTGAKPLFFLDYYACNQLNPEEVDQVLTGICQGCKLADCSLVGGEMAEMGNMYQPKDFDLAGFACGIVEKSKYLSGKTAQAGDKLYALPAAGFHSNGYSLVRRVLKEHPELLEKVSMQVLLTPTKIYVKDCLNLLEKHAAIRAFAHITGGGLEENIQRLLPDHLAIKLDRSAINVLDCFKALQQVGEIAEEEMWRVFNMGVGMVVITPDNLEESDNCYQIGELH